MDVIISLVSDLIMIIFNLALYMKLTSLKKDTRLYHSLRYGLSGVIVAGYLAAVYIFKWPFAMATFLCLTIPSFLLFFILSKYKGTRFIVTFCFVDTVTYIIAFCAKMALLQGGSAGGMISMTVLFFLCTCTYYILQPYCEKYRELMDRVPQGWGLMAVSAVFIYLLLSFSAMYPTPIISRMEYVPVYVVQCITVLVFYGVFLEQIMHKAQLTCMNQQLQQQQHWHRLAYMDELTQLANHAAYTARTEELENEDNRRTKYAVMLLDIDNFKQINDTRGHHYGNEVLKNSAEYFMKNFSDRHYEFFRAGGDEFTAIVRDVPDSELQAVVHKINTIPMSSNPGCTYSCGYSEVDFTQGQPFEQALIRADHAMYLAKNSKKQRQK